MRKHKDDMQVNVAGLRRNIKNLAHNYSDAQVKVREATSNDPWGPSATIMAEIAELTNNVVAFSEIMQMIWKRLNDHGKNWRHVYKALILLEYLIKIGNEKVSQQCKENIFAIQTLREFVYFEEGKDQGTHVREKAKQLVILLKDDERLKNERVKALKAKERFLQYPSGFGSDGYIDGPSQRDMPPGWQEEPAKPVSELELVRPQTAGEEELQLQLAMAMSREEAEQEEAKRRSDDVRLQLALSQSEQDFKHQKPLPQQEENQSHLLDLLDIQLGATSISSPPLGLAAGGLPGAGTDPWITPARAASQMSDPWTGTASPPVDPWQPTAASRSTPLAHLGAVGGMGGAMAMHSNGTNGADAWGAGMRTQSPSVTSGSSAEGWLQTNGNTQNTFSGAAGAGAGAAAADPWLSKPNIPAAASNNAASVDAWLSDSNKPSAAAMPPKTLASDDPWAPKAAAAADDPWKHMENAATKPSPDMDEFDIITNRNKSAGSDLLARNMSPSYASNNNANLLDDLDPLSNNTNLSTNNTISTGATAKKPLKDPQLFLGENSGLVNLDNLIKPAMPQNTANAAAYNPFSDTVIPPKTNLFQQQQPAVPSINQLKQQSFQMTMNQDPWAPVNNAAASQFPTKPEDVDLLIVDLNKTNGCQHPSLMRKDNATLVPPNYQSEDIDLCIVDLPNTPKLKPNGSLKHPAAISKSNASVNMFGITAPYSSMKHSRSNYEGFQPLLHNVQHPPENLFTTSVGQLRSMALSTGHAPDAASTRFMMDSTDVHQASNSYPTHLSYPSLYPHVEILNKSDNHNVSMRSPPSSPSLGSPLASSTPYSPLSPTYVPFFDSDHNNNNINNHNLNNTISSGSYSYQHTSLGPFAADSHSHSHSHTPPQPFRRPTAAGNAAAISMPSYSHAFQASLAATPGVTIRPLGQQNANEPASLFSYGFFDTATNDSPQSPHTQYSAESNNNNSMGWTKPEAAGAASSNPFLS